MKTHRHIGLIRSLATALVVLLVPALATAQPVTVFAGDDGWRTPNLPSFGVTSELNFAAAPLPAGFFGPGSDPFVSLVPMKGKPLAGLNPIDTVVRRLADTVPLNLGQSDTVPIEIVALDLVSVAPITVTFNGGQNPEQWDVEACLSSVVPQNQGTMTITRSHPDGGTYSVNAPDSLPINAKVIFTRVVGGNQVVLDPHADIAHGVGVWTLENGPGGFVRPPFLRRIVPGVNLDGDCDGAPDNVTVGDSNFVGNVDPNTRDCNPNSEQAMLAKHGILPPIFPLSQWTPALPGWGLASLVLLMVLAGGYVVVLRR